jgi:hypothetical protein
MQKEQRKAHGVHSSTDRRRCFYEGFGPWTDLCSRKLPESTKAYLKRHSDELKLNAKTLALTQAFKSNANSKLWAGREPDKEADGSSIAANLLQVLSAILKDSHDIGPNKPPLIRPRGHGMACIWDGGWYRWGGAIRVLFIGAGR